MTKRYRGRRIDQDTGVWSPSYFLPEVVENDIIQSFGEIAVIGPYSIVAYLEGPGAAGVRSASFANSEAVAFSSTPLIMVQPIGFTTETLSSTVYNATALGFDFSIHDDAGAFVTNPAFVLAFGNFGGPL